MIDEDIFAEGTMFRRLVDLPAGRRSTNPTCCLMPDPVYRDDRSVSSPRPPWFITCDVLEPTTRRALQPRPRAAWPRRPRRWFKSMGVGRHRVLRTGSRVSSCSTDVRFPDPRPYNTPASSSDSSELPINFGPPNMRAATSATASAPRRATSRWPPQDSVQDMRSEMLRRPWPRWAVKVEEASPRSRFPPPQHELGMKFDTHDADGRPDADLQILHPSGRRHIYGKDRHLHARSRSMATTARACTAHQSIWKDGKAGIRRQQNTPTCRRTCPVLTSPASSSTPKVDQRLHQPVDQFLQAPGPGL